MLLVPNRGWHQKNKSYHTRQCRFFYIIVKYKQHIVKRKIRFILKILSKATPKQSVNGIAFQLCWQARIIDLALMA